MMKRFSCARNGHGEAADVEEPEIRIGWRQEWTSPERLEENGSVRIRDVVRGPFQTPRLLKARPFFAASTKNEGIGAISDRKQTLRRGIPDTWSEYLAIQGHCDTRDTKFLQENGIPCCTRCHVTDIIWKRLGVPLTQGIPDPSRVLPLFRSKSKERISDPCVNKEAEGNIDRPTFVPCNRGRDKKVHPVKNRRRKSGNMRRNERDDKLNGSNVEYDKTKKHGYKGFRRYKERDDKLDTSSQADHKQGVGRRLNGDSNKNCYTVKSSASHSRSFGGFEKRKGSPPGSSHIDEPEGNKARQVRITDVQYIEEPTTSEESKKNSTRLVSIGHKGAKNGTGVQVPGPRRRRIRSRRCRQRSINDKRNDSKANHGRSYEKGGGPKAKETQVQGEDRSASQGGKSGDSKCKDDEKRVVDRTVDRISFEAERDRRMASFSDIEKSREENTCRVCRSCKRIAEKSTMERKYHDTIGCGCALRISQSFVPGKDCISKRVNQFEGCDTSNLVLCEACEDIYHKDHSWKSFPDLRNAERPVGLAKNSRSRATSNRHEELYEKTKRKICFCVERAKRIILSSNFLGGEKERSGKKVRLEPRSEARAMRETSFVCCRCDCPYLKVAFDHHANREFSNTLESLGRDKPKKKQKLLGSKHGNLKDTALQRVEKFDGALNSEKRVCTRTGNKICVSAHIDERFSCSNNVTSVHASKPRKKRASEGKTRHETVNSSIHLPTPRLTVNTNDYSDANRRNKIHNLAQVNHKEFSSKRMSSRDKQFHLIPKDSFKDNSRNFVGNKTTNKGQDCSYTDSENCTRVHVENKLNASTYVNGSFIGLKELFEEEKAKRMTTVRKNNKRYIPPCNSKKTIQTDTDRFAGNHDVYSRTSSGHGVIFRTKEDNRAIFSETTRRINHEKENVGKIGDHCSKLKGETREKKKETEYARRVKSNNPEESPSDSGERADISDFSDDLKVNIATTGERSSAIVKTLVKRLNAKLALRGNDRGPNEHRCAVSRKSTSQRCKSNSDDDEGSLTPENYECPKLFLNRSMVGELCESAAATDRKEYEKLSIEAFHDLCIQLILKVAKKLSATQHTSFSMMDRQVRREMELLDRMIDTLQNKKV
ncbi:hypothetical protein KM043_015233 [Ampulex compressa]|nr:hypothetical protein KM043_015233 [Ampulex compressa]